MTVSLALEVDERFRSLVEVDFARINGTSNLDIVGIERRDLHFVRTRPLSRMMEDGIAYHFALDGVAAVEDVHTVVNRRTVGMPCEVECDGVFGSELDITDFHLALTQRDDTVGKGLFQTVRLVRTDTPTHLLTTQEVLDEVGELGGAVQVDVISAA